MAAAEILFLAISYARVLLALTIGIISVYALTRCIYLLYFHPLAKYPGPKIAAISNVWYGYHWISGRYPWASEQVLRRYGDIVRIAPNELLFIKPQAFTDIYTPHIKNHELFVKTELNDRGDEHGGIAFERDPVRHRIVSKQLSPAFSSRSITAKESAMHEHIDLFVDKMMTHGAAKDGVDLAHWCNWLAMDISADITYNRKMNQIKDMKNSVYLDVLLGFNKFTTIEQVSLRFPFLKRFRKLFLPVSAVTSMPEMVQKSRAELQRRLGQKGKTEHLDFFDQIVPDGSVIPEDPREVRHLEQLAAQLLFGGFEPVSSWFYGTFMSLLEEPEMYQILAHEIRHSFTDYRDIVPGNLATLPYLNACLEESLRTFPSNNLGHPRISPGAQVDGAFIPKGVYCQTSMFAMWRDPRFFHEPLKFRPQRWLPSSHPLYESKFSKDSLKSFYPMGQGPRACIGKEVAWRITRLFIAKVLWTFDLVNVPGQKVEFEKDFVTYGFWVKPELRARFVAV
ncbi:cytochrome P450 [Hypoxylon rubiginosum]|uniref:Cytochrome P450 n=1 Tax=Hypoxylon rubiginosum TaxID=110542 RepID=A0ACC0CMN8_9PEZI|nr:cytochrome P450 [Hypoxylon rubiginosum]